MREILEPWLTERAQLKGLMGCGVRYRDESFFIPPTQHGFERENLEHSLRCIADTFKVLKLNNLPDDYARWIYHNVLLYCLRREDGIVLGVFTSRETDAVDLEGLERMLNEFRNLKTVTS